MMLSNPAILLLLVTVGVMLPRDSQASLLYSADFSTPDQGFSHTSDTPPASGPQAANGGSNTGIEGRWTASYSTTPSTDSFGPNTFITSGGQMLVQDWGGEGTFESHSLDVSGQDYLNIQGINAVLRNGADQGGEYFRFFYRLDGGTPVYQDMSGGGTYEISGLNVSSNTSITVGFNFNVDGDAGSSSTPDGWSVSSLTINATPVPEPSTILFSGILAILGPAFMIFRRFRRTLHPVHSCVHGG
jgi:hypothetical protein